MELRDKIARALFEKDSKHMTGKQSEWAWQNLLLREETDSYWHGAADAVLAVLDLDKVRAEAQVEALREVAQAWQTGGWAQDMPQRDYQRAQLIVGMAQRATDFIRDRADRIARVAGIETGENDG